MEKKGCTNTCMVDRLVLSAPDLSTRLKPDTNKVDSVRTGWLIVQWMGKLGSLSGSDTQEIPASHSIVSGGSTSRTVLQHALHDQSHPATASNAPIMDTWLTLEHYIQPRSFNIATTKDLLLLSSTTLYTMF